MIQSSYDPSRIVMNFTWRAVLVLSTNKNGLLQ